MTKPKKAVLPTALAKIPNETAAALATADSTSRGLLKQAQSIQVTDQITLAQAGALKLALQAEWSRLEDLRKFFVKPLNDHVKAINQGFKPKTEALDAAMHEVHVRMSKFIQDENRKAQEKADRELARKEKANAKWGLPAPQPKPVELMVGVKSEEATVYTVRSRKFRVTDETKVPARFMTVDETAVKSYLKNFKIDEEPPVIPGIEFYIEESVGVR